MTDKLNMHTDPSGLLESLKAATDGRPYLGDPLVVDGLLRKLAVEVLERYDEVGHGVLTPEEAANADRAGCQRLASILCGHEPAYAPVREWTGPQLADHLRDRMRRDIVDDEDDQSVVAQSIAVLVHKLYDVLRQSKDGKSEAAAMEDASAAIKSMTMALVGVVGND